MNTTRTSPKRKADVFAEELPQNQPHSPLGNLTIERSDEVYSRGSDIDEEVTPFPTLKKRCIAAIRSSQSQNTASILNKLITRNISILSVAQDPDFQKLSDYVGKFDNALDLSGDIDEVFYSQIEHFFQLNSPTRNQAFFDALLKSDILTSSETTTATAEASNIDSAMNNLFLDNIRLKLLNGEFEFLAQCLTRSINISPAGNWASDAHRLENLCMLYQNLVTTKNNIITGLAWLDLCVQRRHTKGRDVEKPSVYISRGTKEIEKADRKLQTIREKLRDVWRFNRFEYCRALSFLEGSKKSRCTELYEAISAICNEQSN